jgi:plasmid stabilization system protein ParE
MRIRWLRSALRTLDHHANYIAKNDAVAARNAVQRIQAAVDQLAEYPSMGRIGRVPLTRELIVGGTPWIIVYRLRAEMVEIIRVLHGAQSWPPQR